MVKFLNQFIGLFKGVRLIKSDTFIKNNKSLITYIFVRDYSILSINNIYILSFYLLISVLHIKEGLLHKELESSEESRRYDSKRCEVIIKLRDSSNNYELRCFYSLKLFFQKDADTYRQVLSNYINFVKELERRNSIPKGQNLELIGICIKYKAQ